MIISRTYDIELIRSVVTSDAFWDFVTEDGAIKECYEPSLQKYVWLSVEEDSELLALIAVEHISAVTIRVHPMVLINYRDKSREIIRQFVIWLDLTGYQKLIAEIPEIYRHVRLFAAWAGLKKEGVRTESHLKNGKMVDVYLYGATRAELNKRFK